MTHSLPDQALAYQLEGDLLRSFNDEAALEKYYLAAQLYKKQDRHIEAIAVFEHLLSIDPYHEEYLCQVISLYAKLEHNAQRIAMHITTVIPLLLQKQNFDRLIIILDECRYSTDAMVIAQGYYALLLALLNNNSDEKIVMPLLYKVLDSYIATNSTQLQSILSTISSINESYYQEACNYIQQHAALS